MEKKKFKEIACFWKDDKRNYVKRSTISAYVLILENHLLPYFGEMTEINETTVQNFALANLKSGLSQKTIKDILIVLKMVVRYGAKHCGFAFQDWKVIFPTEQAKKGIEVLTIAEHKKLINYLTDNFTFRNLGILICLNTGMRIGEICALKWGDIDIARGIISVNKTIERIYVVEEDEKHTELIISTPKTANSNREIPITKPLHKILKPLKSIVSDDYFVLTNEPTPTEPRTYRNYFKQILEQLKLRPIKFHGLRHSFATRCIESQCDYKTLSVILGHSNISTTLNLYVHPNFEQQKRCIDKMTKLLL